MSKPQQPHTPLKTGEGKAERPERDAHIEPDNVPAGGPSDASVIGEEDPGAGLEFLVKRDKPKSDSQDD